MLNISLLALWAVIVALSVSSEPLPLWHQLVLPVSPSLQPAKVDYDV